MVLGVDQSGLQRITKTEMEILRVQSWSLEFDMFIAIASSSWRGHRCRGGSDPQGYCQYGSSGCFVRKATMLIWSRVQCRWLVADTIPSGVCGNLSACVSPLGSNLFQ